MAAELDELSCREIVAAVEPETSRYQRLDVFQSLHIPGRFLDAVDLRVLRQAPHRLRQGVGNRAPRHAIENHWLLPYVRDGRKVPEQALLYRDVVIRCYEQVAVNLRLSHGVRQFDSLASRVGAGTSTDWQ